MSVDHHAPGRLDHSSQRLPHLVGGSHRWTPSIRSLDLRRSPAAQANQDLDRLEVWIHMPPSCPCPSRSSRSGCAQPSVTAGLLPEVTWKYLWVHSKQRLLKQRNRCSQGRQLRIPTVRRSAKRLGRRMKKGETRNLIPIGSFRGGRWRDPLRSCPGPSPGFRSYCLAVSFLLHTCSSYPHLILSPLHYRQPKNLYHPVNHGIPG